MDEDPGFLPGDLKEKSMPLLAGITDALISMHSDDSNEHNTFSTIEHIIEKANIEFTSMAYFRGRSLDDAFLIIDEAQNMTRAQMKGMLSRGGKNCRTVVLANLAQIDDKFVTVASSGASAAVNVYRNYEKGSVLIFDEVERSSLAEFTEKNFQSGIITIKELKEERCDNCIANIWELTTITVIFITVIGFLMARQTSTKIDVADLEFIIEYLILLAQSKRAFQLDIPLYKSVNRVKLYKAAISVETALLEKRDKDFIEAIDRVCVDVEGIVVNTIPRDEIQRLKTAIRQKRYKNNDFNRLLNEYQSTLKYLESRSEK